jgi:hypothetical protein
MFMMVRSCRVRSWFADVEKLRRGGVGMERVELETTLSGDLLVVGSQRRAVERQREPSEHPDPGAYDRTNYYRVLRSWRG